MQYFECKSWFTWKQIAFIWKYGCLRCGWQLRFLVSTIRWLIVMLLTCVISSMKVLIINEHRKFYLQSFAWEIIDNNNRQQFSLKYYEGLERQIHRMLEGGNQNIQQFCCHSLKNTNYEVKWLHDTYQPRELVGFLTVWSYENMPTTDQVLHSATRYILCKMKGSCSWTLVPHWDSRSVTPNVAPWGRRKQSLRLFWTV